MKGKDEDFMKLSAAQISALCSNLARGCEKQYKNHESELYKKLATYFDSITPEERESETGKVSELISEDLKENYVNARNISTNENDRGALRVCNWGEKVSLILKMLLERYENEGESFLETLKNTNIWVCTICGFVYIGDKAPELCPVCKVPEWKFEKIEGEIA